METPETRYAVTSDGVHIAYQVSGTGGVDVLWSEGWLSHVEILWELPHGRTADSSVNVDRRRGWQIPEPVVA